MAKTDSTGSTGSSPGFTRRQSTGATWRYRWAHRQNERRQRTYRDAERAWRRRDDELRRLRAAAADFGRQANAGAGLPLELAPGERVFWALPAVQLVELRHTAVLPAPDLCVDPGRSALHHRRPDGVKVTDAGLAVLTDRRLVLLGGRGRRDWTYGRMTGLAHDPAAPITLIQVLDRRRTSGLLLPADAAAEFRFTLTLAFAEAIEQRGAVLAQLDELIAEHDQTRPFRPAIATPAQARITSLVPGGRRTVAVAAAAALLVPAVLFESDPPVRPGSDVAAAATAAPPTAGPTGLPTARAAAASASKPRHGTVSSAAASSPAPPAATRDRLCGAPANPFGYDYCGGSRIRRPDVRVCDYFDCGQDFWAGTGYLVQCRDGALTLTGGRADVCAAHDGLRRTVWS
ncbi:hypothetical protein [Micromonospora carbonacea]|uniref:Uncharacterized protein n=1 Tax=Micromonospora carbonacea TaxID=47853 RepID=A0A7H8XH01_9ACTN|nr:hypothetical protein [Micromonospora carbonacea]MBB5828417.1 hypothetical protein [Micromonospora carbonacea]QLD23975.1 hypothetical protein HXZ27_06895 [Micromonospora carbonacea]